VETVNSRRVEKLAVEVTNDLSHALIMVSVLGDENKQEEALQALAKARGYLRTELASRIRLRHAPELTMRLDRSVEHSLKISALLDELMSKGEDIDSH
jgi:ribosome-binding factor A